MPDFPIRKIAVLEDIRREGGPPPAVARRRSRMGGLAAADIKVRDGLR